MAQSTDNGVLHEIVRVIDVAGQRDGEGPQVRNGLEQVGAKVSRKGRSGLWEHVSPLGLGGEYISRRLVPMKRHAVVGAMSSHLQDRHDPKRSNKEAQAIAYVIVKRISNIPTRLL
jgi:hypothetical protein